MVLWGFLATLVLTSVLRYSQALQMTRMDLPFILGAALTADRDRAKIAGFLVHLLNGWILAFLYLAIFRAAGRSSWWLGALLGLAHAAFVMGVIVPLLPAVHPRMASETRGPDPTPLLEPPGFLALNYGPRTPLVSAVAHVIYGAILGALAGL